MAEQDNITSWEFPPIETEHEQQKIDAPVFSDVDENFAVAVKSPEQLRQEAVEQGYKEGFEKAEKEAIQVVTEKLTQEFQQQWQIRLDHLNTLIQLFEKPLASFEEQIDELILTLVRTLVTRLIRREYTEHPEALMSLVMNLKEEIGHTRHLSVYVSPADYEKLQDIIKEGLPGHLSADENLHSGDIRIEADSGVLQAKLNERLDQLLGLK